MSKQKAFSQPNLPLTPAIFYILLALATKKRHGYDIMKQVAQDSNGKVTLGPGTLYGAIKRMLEEKLLQEVEKHSSERRRYYALTEKGKTLFSNELLRYSQTVELAKQKGIFGIASSQKILYAYR